MSSGRSRIQEGGGNIRKKDGNLKVKGNHTIFHNNFHQCTCIYIQAFHNTYNISVGITN